MGTYLSIDMDYWFRNGNEDFDSMYKLLNFTSTIDNKFLVQEHHELLPHINDCDPDHIVHVDYHQDIAFPYRNNERMYLNCGTFFYFVEKRQEKTFKWFYPNYSTCILDHGGLCVDSWHKPFSKKNHIFKDQTMKCGVPTRKDLAHVSAVGISLSQDYSEYRLGGRQKHALKAARMLYNLFGENEVRDILTEYGNHTKAGFYAY